MFAAISQIVLGFLDWRRWGWLGLYDVVLTNRRSFIGMWWPTLSVAIFSFGVGHLFSSLMGRPLEEFLPHIVLGWLVWQLISTGVTQGAVLFVINFATLTESTLPPNTIVLRALTRLVIQFLLGLLVVAVALLYVRQPVGLAILIVPVSLVLNLFVLHGAMLFLGIIAARFRDFSELIDAGMRLAFFLTPIIWMAEQAAEMRSILTNLNPFFYMLEVIRAPFTQGAVPWTYLLIVLGLGVASNIAGLVAFAVSRRRLVYWL